MNYDLRHNTREIQKLVGAKVDGVYGLETSGKIIAALRHEKVDDITVLRFDNRTETSLNTLKHNAHAKLRPFVRRAISIGASMGVSVKVICGYRTKTDQEAAKAKGASKAGFGYSWHNYGMAIDFGCFQGNSYVDADNPKLASEVYRAIGALAKDYQVEWGGSWKTFKDYPHFHVDIGRSTPNAEDRKRLAEGSWHY